jgi:hypothetical protein
MMEPLHIEVIKPGSTVYVSRNGAVTKEVISKVETKHEIDGNEVRYKLEGHRRWFEHEDLFDTPDAAFNLQPSTDDQPGS